MGRKGLAAFAILPGIVHTAMLDYAVASGSPAVSGLFQRALAEGRDVPPDRAANLVVALASGKADALSGSCIGITHDLDDLIARADELRRADLLRLRPTQR